MSKNLENKFREVTEMPSPLKKEIIQQPILYWNDIFDRIAQFFLIKCILDPKSFLPFPVHK